MKVLILSFWLATLFSQAAVSFEEQLDQIEIENPKLSDKRVVLSHVTLKPKNEKLEKGGNASVNYSRCLTEVMFENLRFQEAMIKLTFTYKKASKQLMVVATPTQIKSVEACFKKEAGLYIKPTLEEEKLDSTVVWEYVALRGDGSSE